MAATPTPPLFLCVLLMNLPTITLCTSLFLLKNRLPKKISETFLFRCSWFILTFWNAMGFFGDSVYLALVYIGCTHVMHIVLVGCIYFALGLIYLSVIVFPLEVRVFINSQAQSTWVSVFFHLLLHLHLEGDSVVASGVLTLHLLIVNLVLLFGQRHEALHVVREMRTGLIALVILCMFKEHYLQALFVGITAALSYLFSWVFSEVVPMEQLFLEVTELGPM